MTWVQFLFAVQQNSLSLLSWDDTGRGFLLGRSPEVARGYFLLFLRGGGCLAFWLGFAEVWCFVRLTPRVDVQPYGAGFSGLGAKVQGGFSTASLRSGPH